MLSLRALLHEPIESPAALCQWAQEASLLQALAAEIRVLVDDTESQQASRWTQCHREPLPQACLCFDDITLDNKARVSQIMAERWPDAQQLWCETTCVLRPERRPNQRTAGTVQICTFERKSELTEAEFQQRWLVDHTPIALATQSTQGYLQSRIIKDAITSADGLVEEYFPAAAGHSLSAFFNAADNPGLLENHINRMVASCDRFIESGSINVIHMSEYPIQLRS